MALNEQYLAVFLPLFNRFHDRAKLSREFVCIVRTYILLPVTGPGRPRCTRNFYPQKKPPVLCLLEAGTIIPRCAMPTTSYNSELQFLPCQRRPWRTFGSASCSSGDWEECRKWLTASGHIPRPDGVTCEVTTTSSSWFRFMRVPAELTILRICKGIRGPLASIVIHECTSLSTLNLGSETLSLFNLSGFNKARSEMGAMQVIPSWTVMK